MTELVAPADRKTSIKQLLTSPVDRKTSIKQLLVFQIQDVSFGVDARQVSSIVEPQNSNLDKTHILQLHKIIPFKDQSFTFQSPKLLMVNTTIGRKAIYVESPDDMIFIKRSVIKPIPALILKLNISNAIWGVLLREGRTILVVDIERLITEDRKSEKISGT